MQSTTSFTFILLICCMHVTLATRLPMEIVEVTSSQIIGGDEKKIGRHKTSTNGGGGAGTVIVDSNGGSGSFALEQRKGRQIAEVHTPRILYQVGVSGSHLLLNTLNIFENIVFRLFVVFFFRFLGLCLCVCFSGIYNKNIR